MSDLWLLLLVIMLGLFGVKFFVAGITGKFSVKKGAQYLNGPRKIVALIMGAAMTIISVLMILVYIFA